MSEDKNLDVCALEMSDLCQRYEFEGAAVQIEIYCGEPNGRWLLEVVDDHWNSTVWDDEFETGQAALDAALAAFSGASLNSGGSSQDVIDTGMAGLTLSSSGAAELNQSAKRLLIEEALTTERQTDERITDAIAETLNTSAPAPAPPLTITSGDTFDAVDEHSGAGQVVYTAAATAR